MALSVGWPEVLLVAAVAFLFSIRWKSASAHPPGPKGLPIIGNVLDMPKAEEWLTFAEWGRQWGPIVSVNLMGQRMTIVNSADIMEEMDKKGGIYSDRPKLEMAGELVGYVKTLVLLPYGNRLRNFRKHVFKLVGSPSSVARFASFVEHETRLFLRHMLKSQDDLEAKLRKTSGAIIMRLAYGIDVLEEKDPFVALIERANENFNIVTSPGAFLVDVFPALRHMPEWMPGAGFKRLAREYRKAFDDMVEVPFKYAVELLSSGKAHLSFVSSSLENERELTDEYVDEIKHTAASLYGAGADTTVSAQHGFFLAMILHPDVQKAAQAEIDAVIGNDRLPTFADRERLPYVNAVVSEALRWHNVAPLGVPHRAAEDGIVGGYFVPKGALIVANLWNMLHDPAVYPDPFNFDPTRFLGQKPQRDPRHACFGFARRICPGMHLAEASLYILVVMSLAVFDILPFKDENGVEDVPEHGNTSGTISHPKPFRYTIRPRSEKAVALISAEYLATA